MDWWHAMVFTLVVAAGAGVGFWVLAHLLRALAWISGDLSAAPLDREDAAAMGEELLSR